MGRPRVPGAPCPHESARRAAASQSNRAACARSRAPARSHALEPGAQRKWQGRESPGGSAAWAASPQRDLCASLRHPLQGGRRFRALSNAGDQEKALQEEGTTSVDPPPCRSCAQRALPKKLAFLSSPSCPQPHLYLLILLTRFGASPVLQGCLLTMCEGLSLPVQFLLEIGRC